MNEERGSCAHCRRPRAVCYCAHIHTLDTRTRVVLLQHPRERRVGVGTARMAHLSLPNSVLRVGLDFSADAVVRQTLLAPQPVCVLFPRTGARDVSELPRDRPVTLVVLDGTWTLARKLLTLNPALAALPRVAFTPRRPSGYRIRRQPADNCLSTIEALAEVLQVIEPENGPFDKLLAPFHAMVSRQVDYINDVNAHRHRHRRTGLPVRPSPWAKLAARLVAVWQRLVCVQGDANAWPRREGAEHRPEIVHWTAHRPATGETYEAVVAPRGPLNPATPQQIELPAATLAAGAGADEWASTWGRFCRPDDVFVVWGTFYDAVATPDLPSRPSAPLASSLLASSGAATGAGWPSSWTIDLRAELLRCLHEPRAGSVARRQLRAQVRTVDGCASAVELSPASLRLPFGLPLSGRAGRRLAALVAVVGALTTGEPLVPRSTP